MNSASTYAQHGARFHKVIQFRGGLKEPPQYVPMELTLPNPLDSPAP